MSEVNDKSLLREKNIQRNSNNEFNLLKRWFDDYERTDFPNRFKTSQYHRHLERYQEMSFEMLTKKSKVSNLKTG
jgi:hypothetical protein